MVSEKVGCLWCLHELQIPFWKSSTYDSVRLHDLSRLYKTPEYLLDKYKDQFLTKFDVPIYLEEYAKYYQIFNHTIFRLKVIRISHEANEEYGWKIIGLDLNENDEKRYICKYLCIATSYCRIPFIPANLRKSLSCFQGKSLHSVDYKNPSDFDIRKHQKILLIVGGHSSSEIATELTYARFHVTIAHRGGQYFLKHDYWTPYLSNQTIEKPLQYWKYSMNDIQFKQLLDKFDEQFFEHIYPINDDLNWTVPSLKPASFIILHKKTFIDDPHFIHLVENKSIQIKGTVEEILQNGVKFENESEMEAFGGIIFCTGFTHGLEQFLDNANEYLSVHRYPHLPAEKSSLPKTNGRLQSTMKKNLFFPGFDYGINQRVDFALYSFHVGETILKDIFGKDFLPELSSQQLE